MQVTQGSTAGDELRDWCVKAKVGYSTYFTIPVDQRPRSMRLGRKYLIVESAADWQQRMADSGGIKSRRPKAGA